MMGQIYFQNTDMEKYDPYANAEVFLNHNGTQLCGVVRGRKWEWDGKICGKANANPILDTRVYNVSLPDGTQKDYSANIIASSMGHNMIVRQMNIFY